MWYIAKKIIIFFKLDHTAIITDLASCAFSIENPKVGINQFNNYFYYGWDSNNNRKHNNKTIMVFLTTKTKLFHNNATIIFCDGMNSGTQCRHINDRMGKPNHCACSRIAPFCLLTLSFEREWGLFLYYNMPSPPFISYCMKLVENGHPYRNSKSLSLKRYEISLPY